MADIDDKLDEIEAQLADSQDPTEGLPNSSPLQASNAPLTIEDFLSQRSNLAPPQPASAPAASPSDDDSDDDSTSPAVTGGQAGVLAGTGAPATSPPVGSLSDDIKSTFPGTPAPSAGTPSVADYIAQKLAAQNQQLQGAQQQAGKNRLIAGLTEGIGQIGAGLAHQKTFDPNSYKFLTQNAEAPVEDVLQKQKAQQAALQQIGTENTVAQSAAMDDPNSVQSTVSRNLAASMLKKYGEDPSIVQGMSASDLKDFIEKPLDQMETRDSREQIAQLKAKELNQKAAQASDDRSDRQTAAADAKTTADQNKAFLQTGQLLESARGNPAASQAEKDIYAAQKANSLATMYGDPNKLNPQQTQLLRNEISKIASGQGSTQAELEGLDPKTLNGALAGVWQKFSNSPSPANAGSFIKTYQDYANQVTKDAQKVITDKYGRIINSRKQALGDDNYNALKEQYLDRFNNAAQATGGGGDDPLTAEMKKRGLIQ